MAMARWFSLGNNIAESYFRVEKMARIAVTLTKRERLPRSSGLYNLVIIGDIAKGIN
jgi:hypothetical protein